MSSKKPNLLGAPPWMGLMQTVQEGVGDGMTAGLLSFLLLWKDVGQFSYTGRKELWYGRGAPRGVILLICSNMFWARVVVHPFHSSASSWFVSDIAFINTHTSSYTELAEGLGQGFFGCK